MTSTTRPHRHHAVNNTIWRLTRVKSTSLAMNDHCNDVAIIHNDVILTLVSRHTRIRNKISTLCFNVTLCFSVISGSAPPYLSDLLQVYIPSSTLCSSADTRTFRVPHRRKKFQVQRAFSYIGPVTWNSLPVSVRHAQIFLLVNPDSRFTFSVNPSSTACP